MSDGNIEIGLELNGAKAKSQANKLGQQIGQEITSEIDKTKKSTTQAVNEIGKAVEGYGKSYSKAVTLPIVAAAGASAAAAVKIDTALTGVRKTVDATEEQYQGLKDAAIEFSKTNAVDPAQILDIQALGAQLSYLPDELSMFGEVVSGLDIATNMEADVAATQLAQFANIMGMAHEDTKRYGSTIVELGNNFATTEADISNMAQRIAGAGKQIGLSEADVLGLATALSSMGISAEAGGTAISTIMSQIDKAVALNSDSLATWAEAAQMSTEDFAAAWKENAVDALSSVLVGMDAAVESGGNMAVMLDELGISSIRQTDALKRLASNSEFLGNAVETANNAWEENIALDKEVENRNNSMEAQMQILFNRVQAIAIEVGEPLMEAVLGILDAADPLIDMLASGAKQFADLDTEGQQAILMAVGLVAAFGPLTTLTGKMISGFGKTSEAWRKFGDNLRTVRDNIKKSTTEISKATAANSRYKIEMMGSHEVIKKYNREGQLLKVTTQENTAAFKLQTTAMKLSNTAAKVGAQTMNVLKVAVKGVGTALKTIAPVAIFTTAIELFTGLAGAAQKSAEKQKLHQDATQGLRDAAAGLTVNLDEEVDAFSSLASTIKEVDVDGLLQSHRELAQTITENNQQAFNSQAMLDQYRETIGRLAGTVIESEDDVARLKLAVDGVNEATGENLAVVQDADGAYQILREGVALTVDEIYKLIDAQKAQVRAEVELENYRATYQEYQKDQKALVEAVQAVTAAEEAAKQKAEELGYSRDQWNNTEIEGLQEVQGAYVYYQKKLEGVEEAARTSQSALNKLTEQQILTKKVTEGTASALEKAADENEAFKASVQGADVDLNGFIKALEDVGFTAEDVSSLGVEEATKLVQGWKQGTQGLIDATEEVGLKVPDKLREAGEKGGQAAQEGLQEGLSENANLAIDEAIKTVGMTRDEFNRLAEQAGISGEEATVEFAKGLKSKRWEAGDAAELVINDVHYEMNPDTQEWGYHFGNQWVIGFSSGMEPAGSKAASYIGEIAKNLKFSVPEDGPFSGSEKGGETSGRHLGENFIRGFVSTKDQMKAAAEDWMESAKEVIDGIAYEFDDMGNRMAKGVVVGFEAEQPMKQIEQSIQKGVSQMTIAAMQATSGNVYNTNRNQTVNFNGSVNSPDEITRQLRLQELYGLAGE